RMLRSTASSPTCSCMCGCRSSPFFPVWCTRIDRCAPATHCNSWQRRFVASTWLYCLHRAMHHEVPPLYQLWTIYVFPYWHLWFVQALLVVFGALFILETAG